MDVSATADHTFEVSADPDTAFALVSDVPDSVSHFPELEGFVADGADTWRWELAKLGHGPLTLQTVYTCHYVCDAAARTVTWTAVSAAQDNARVEGTWTLTPTRNGTRLRLVNTLTVTVPVPRLMRKPAEKLVSRENERLISAYVGNIQTTLNGGNGRQR